MILYWSTDFISPFLNYQLHDGLYVMMLGVPIAQPNLMESSHDLRTFCSPAEGLVEAHQIQLSAHYLSCCNGPDGCSESHQLSRVFR